MIRNTRARRCLGAAAVAALAALVAPSFGAGPSSAQAVPEVQVDPTSGTTADSFEAVGTGCEGGFITHRFDDGGTQGMFVTTDGSGEWTQSANFPAPVGAHTVTFDCSDPTTVGAPTTFYGPGEVRFSYDPVDLTTLEGDPITDPNGPCIGGGGSGDGGGTVDPGTTDPGTGVTGTENTVVDPPPAAPVETTDTSPITDPTETTDTVDPTDTTEPTETTVPGPIECIADALPATAEALPATAEAATATYTG